MEGALLAEVLAKPDDDGPRLILADHWIERGDPRGELVVTQCEEERPGLDRETRRRLARCADNLLAAHGERWLSPFALDRDQVSWRRGFIDAISFERPTLPASAGVLAAHPVRAVTAGRCASRDDLRRLCAWAAPSTVTQLSLSGATDAETVVALVDTALLRQLRSLSLVGFHVSGDAMRTVLASASPALRELTLIHDALDGDVAAVAAHAWSRLTLIRCGVTAAGARAIARGPHAGELEVLSLGENPLGVDGITALTRASLDRLEMLFVNNVDAGDAGARLIAEAPAFRRVTRLSIAGNAVGPEGLRALAGRFPLELLELSGNPITDRGARILASDDALGNLVTLGLRDSRLTCDGIRALLRAPGLGALSELALQGLPVADGVAAVLSEPGVARLEDLDLSRTQLDDDGVLALAASPALANLESLRLAENPITERGARALAASPYLDNLESLSIYGCELGPGVAALRERFRWVLD